MTTSSLPASGKIALVSGANRGIGLAVASALAHAGALVLLGARNLEAGRAAAAPLREEGLAVRAVQLDVTDQASVDALAARIGTELGQIDILVNNAGLGLDQNAELSWAARLEGTLPTNVIGAARLFEATTPLLLRSPAPRVVNLSSELASFGLRQDPDWPFAAFALPTYAASKAAVNALTLSMAEALRPAGGKVNSVCPGYTATDATGYASDRTTAQAAAALLPYALLDSDGPTGGFFNESGPLPW